MYTCLKALISVDCSFMGGWHVRSVVEVVFSFGKN